MQTCAILEPEKESTSKEERPMKKVLILSGSPRKDGNSDLLCSEFIRHHVSSRGRSEVNFKQFAAGCGEFFAENEPDERVNEDE